MDDGGDSGTSQSPQPEKKKLTRNARACLACRKVKTKCKNSGTAPCQRCLDNSFECVFERSHRGGRQPGAKNLSTLRAQGLLPPNRDKNIPANKAAQLHAGHKPAKEPTFLPPPLPSPALSQDTSGLADTSFFNLSHALASPGLTSATSLASSWLTSPVLVNGNSSPGLGNPLMEKLDPLILAASRSSYNGSPHAPMSIELPRPTSAHNDRTFHDSDALLRLMQPSTFSADRTTLSGIDSEMSAPSRHSLSRVTFQQLDPDSVVKQGALQRSRSGAMALELLAESPSSGSQASTTAQGVADPAYWQAGPLSDLNSRRRFINNAPREVMTLLSSDEIDQLVGFYFKHLHCRFTILNPKFHTAERLGQRSPFLLTAICAVAAHFSESHTGKAQQLAELAKRLCFEVPGRGSKTIEIVQAFLILTNWTIASPPQRHEEDKSFLILGLAKSMLGDLGLHRLEPARSLPAERSAEMDNKIRTYLHCYLRDHELSVQMGRTPTMREIPCVRNPDLYLQSPLSMEDLALCMMVEHYRILSRTLEYFQTGLEYFETGSNRCHYKLATSQFEDQLNGWKERYSQLYRQAVARERESGTGTVMDPAEYLLLVEYWYHTAVLAVDSFGLADSLEHSPIDVPYFFTKCYSAGIAALKLIKQAFGEFGDSFKFAGDKHYVCISYICVSLLRFCRPRFSKIHKFNDDITDLVSTVADKLIQTSISPAHMSSSYGLFLRTLVNAHGTALFQSCAPTPRAASPMQEDHINGITVPQGNGGLFGDDIISTEPNKMFDGLDIPVGFGLDQMLPSQWSALDKRFDTVYSLAASETWDSVLPPGFNFLPGGSESDFLNLGNF